MTVTGSPYAPHSAAETEEMLATLGLDSEAELFHIPEAVRFDEDFGIEPGSEQEVRSEVTSLLESNDDLVEFLGRGHYEHYVPSIVDHLADRSEFLTSYTQYQPEVSQGYLQALFEYQSIMAELTGLPIVNASMYDHATALGEAALLAARVGDGDTVLVPELIREERKSVLRNYIGGAELSIETYPCTNANVDLDGLEDVISSETVFVYTESPNSRGAIEERLADVVSLANDYDALTGLGTDPVAMALLESPAEIGIDIVVGDAAVLGLGAAYGMGLGLMACRESYLRQVPGRLIGASEDENGCRAYTLTLQTREQHIRRERATSNICTNQAWIALRVAMHAAWLGPGGLVDLAEQCVQLPRELAADLDSIAGIQAPVDDRYHFREFVGRTDRPASSVVEDLRDAGFAIHAIDTHEFQCCITDANADHATELVAAFEEVV